MGVGVAVGVSVAVGVMVGVDVGVGGDVAEGMGVGVAVGRGVLVGAEVGTAATTSQEGGGVTLALPPQAVSGSRKRKRSSKWVLFKANLRVFKDSQKALFTVQHPWRW